MDTLTSQCWITNVQFIELSLSLCIYHLPPPGLLQAVAAMSGKLILAKHVHSENEKEEEEPVFLPLLVT